MYGEGVSKMGELVDLGVKAGIVEKSGAWFSFDSERIGQGRENAKAYLKEHPETAAKIERAIRQNAGLIASQILEGVPESGEAGGAATIGAATIGAATGGAATGGAATGEATSGEENEGGFAAGDGPVTSISSAAARRGRRGA
jgi:hypothetical protein